MPGIGVCNAAVPIWIATETIPPNHDRLRLKPDHAGLLCMVADGSEYRADLLTMPEFGCVMHEKA